MPGGVAPKDGKVWKIRIRKKAGNQPMYYSDERKFLEAVDKFTRTGELLYSAVYELKEVLKK